MLCFKKVESSRDEWGGKEVIDIGIGKSDDFDSVIGVEDLDRDKSLSIDSVDFAVGECVIVFSEHRAIIPVKDRRESKLVRNFENYF